MDWHPFWGVAQPFVLSCVAWDGLQAPLLPRPGWADRRRMDGWIEGLEQSTDQCLAGLMSAEDINFP